MDNVLNLTPYLIRKSMSHTLFSILNFFPDSVLARNKKLKGKYKGQKCFILGSGPSIKQENLSLLYGQNIMTQNNFHMHDEIGELKPKFHVVVPKYQSAQFDQDWVEWIRDMETRLPADCLLFFGKNTKYLIERETKMGERTFYHEQGLNPLFKTTTDCDISKRIMNVPTVITQCLMTAVYLGFSEIYILGMDLSQIVDFTSGKGRRDHVRWYGVSKITRNQAEKDLEDSMLRSGDIYFQHYKLWRQLNMIDNYAISQNIQIANASEVGLLNVFPRVGLKEVIDT
ncbi:MAG: hypothetical protein KDC83_05685 [Flavobacteriales bacterium]|nr:hypothetical protein [Flavobacteriales bacterium]